MESTMQRTPQLPRGEGVGGGFDGLVAIMPNYWMDYL